MWHGDTKVPQNTGKKESRYKRDYRGKESNSMGIQLLTGDGGQIEVNHLDQTDHQQTEEG